MNVNFGQVLNFIDERTDNTNSLPVFFECIDDCGKKTTMRLTDIEIRKTMKDTINVVINTPMTPIFKIATK